ncbi:MAG: hypothetical protein U9R79_07435 [Armatimonadota bacterium]|nr:hypothetical protein [Armatimonadota bacterium]
MKRVHELVEARPEVIEGDLHGIVSLHQLLTGDEDAFERDAPRVLDVTFPTRSLRRLLQRLHVSLGEDAADRKGNFVISGGYGSGKSHALLALYHILSSPELGSAWLAQNDIQFEPPEDVQVILLPMTQAELRDERSVDYLWQPIFEALDYDGFEHTGNNFPTARHLREAVADRTVLLIIDEMERWYGSISAEAQRNANLAFLQNLTEFCEDPDNGVICLLSLLLIEPEIRTIVERVDRFVEDLTGAPDRHEFVLHRLVQSVDREAAKPIVAAYLDEYRQLDAQVRIGDYNEYEQRMLRSYPFHPETIDVVFDRYSSVARTEQTSYQNSRGAMYLLAHALRQAIPMDGPEDGQLVDADLIRVGDISLDIGQLRDDLLNLNPGIVEIARSNHRASRDVQHATPVLSTILMHSLGEEADRNLGADFGEILLGALRPGDGDEALNANQIQACLRRLEDTAVNLHIEENPTRWLFKEDINIQTQINRRARGISDERAQQFIVSTLRDIMGDDDRLAVYPVEEVPDRRDVTFAVALRRLEPEDVIEHIYRGRSYPNAVVVVDPRQGGRIDTDSDLQWMAKRAIAAKEIEDQLLGEVDLRRKVRDIKNATADALRQRIEDRYGHWQIPILDDDTNELTFRREQIALRRSNILARIQQRYTEEHYKTAVMQSVRDRESTPPTVGDIRADFYRQRSYPKPVDRGRPGDGRIDSAIGELARTGQLRVVRGDGKAYEFQDAGTLDASWTVVEAEGGPPPPKPQWVSQFVGAETKTVAEIRAECQRRAEQQQLPQPHDTQIDEVTIELVREGQIELVDGPERIEAPLSVDMQVRKKTERNWVHQPFAPLPKGAMVTAVVQEINKTDLLRNVNITLQKTETGSRIDEDVRDAVGLSTIAPGDDTKVEVSYRLTKAPVSDRDGLVALLNALPDDESMQVSLSLERMERDRS